MSHGFLTGMEPLLVSTMGNNHGIEMYPVMNGVKALSLGFVKGSARMTCLQAILALCMEDSINLRQDQSTAMTMQ